MRTPVAPSPSPAPPSSPGALPLAVLCGAHFMDAIDLSDVTVALPAVQRELGLSTGALGWVVSAYLLGYGGFLLLGGRAADVLGRRRVLLVAVAVAVLVLAPRLIPADADRRPAKLDAIGATLVTLVFSALVILLTEAPSRGWASGTSLGLVVLTAALFGGFVVRERATPQPLLPGSFLARRQTAGS